MTKTSPETSREGPKNDRKPMDQAGWSKLKARLIAPLIKEQRVLYRKHGNPIHAFEAYRIGRIAKVPIPGWVLELLDQWAAVLCEQRPKGAGAIAKALGIARMGGGPSVTSQAETQIRDLRLAQRIFELQLTKPLNESFSVAAEEFHLSRERAEQIWYALTRSPTP